MNWPTHPAYKSSGVQWLGEVPAHWGLSPMFTVGHERTLPNTGLSETNLLSLSYGRIVRKDIDTTDGLLPASFDTYQIVEPCDIVFRLTDLQNDKHSLRSALVPERGIITSAYMAFSPTKIDPIYYSYLMRSYDLTKVFYSRGGGLRQSLKYEDVKRLPILVPPTDEQRVISRFLDRETAKIDVLIDKQEQLIATLREDRAATINEAVTRGIDPHVELVDSNVRWLREIPAHWDVISSRRFFKERKQRARSDADHLTASQKYGVIPQKDFIEREGVRVTQVLLNPEILKQVEAGDFVISMRSFQGGIEFSEFSGAISSAYVPVVPSSDLSSTTFSAPR